MSRLAIGPQTFWIRFGGIWLAVGAPFLGIGIYLGLQHVDTDKRFKTDAQTAQGMVLTKSIRSASNGNGDRSSSPAYHVEYRFAIANGQVVKGEAKISPDVWDRLEERGAIQVTYLPQDPPLSRVEGQETGLALPIIFSTLGGIFTLLGGFAFLKGLGQFRRSQR